jgi:hypothetical protein
MKTKMHRRQEKERHELKGCTGTSLQFWEKAFLQVPHSYRARICAKTTR